VLGVATYGKDDDQKLRIHLALQVGSLASLLDSDLDTGAWSVRVRVHLRQRWLLVDDRASCLWVSIVLQAGSEMRNSPAPLSTETNLLRLVFHSLISES
jgi:hypothetical protein